jgi:hypothetical protein
MRKTSSAALIAGLVLVAEAFVPSASATAQHPGSAAQQRACRPDVYRLCAGEIPNVRKIVGCLKANAGRLSPDCRAVFDGEMR